MLNGRNKDELCWAMVEWLKVPNLDAFQIDIINKLLLAADQSVEEFIVVRDAVCKAFWVPILTAILLAQVHGFPQKWSDRNA